MAALDRAAVLLSTCGEGLDEDITSYLCSVLEEMSLDELRSAETLADVVAPFLVSTESHDEDEAYEVCRRLAQAFGGSGYNKGSNNAIVSAIEDEAPQLLAAPIKMNDTTEVKQLTKKQTFGGAQVVKSDGYVETNSNLESMQMPSTKTAMRRQRKENEALSRKLHEESTRRAEAAAETMAARMAAIRAGRATGGQHRTGVNCDALSLPHPSGRGDLLTDAQLILAPGRRYGLTGRNGVGKTTLMTALANYKIPGLTHLRILLVDQHVEGDGDSALQWLLRADVERTALLEEEKRLQHFISLEDESTLVTETKSPDNDNDKDKEGKKKEKLPSDLRGVDLSKALQEVWDRMEITNMRSAEQRARSILRGLGFTEDMMTCPTTSLSGGWAMRAALAAAIFVDPNLLLLDEPTNHLDLHALVWLEDWLVTKFAGILVVVSHDQFFLDSVCTDVLEMRSPLAGASKSSLVHYAGDYSTYERTIHEKRLNIGRARDVFEKERDKLQEFISREGKKYDNPAHQAQRKMKMKQLASLEEVEVQEDDAELVLRLPSPHGNFDGLDKLVSVRDMSFAWPQAGQEETWRQLQLQSTLPPAQQQKLAVNYMPPLFRGVDFVIQPRARIAIVGRNGCGKTSLLNILMGESDPTEGSVSTHPGCRICMLQQHHYKGEQLDPDKTPLEHMRALPQDESTAVGMFDVGTRQEEAAQRSYLARFGIKRTPAVLPVKYLSGGQRMRVALAVALFRRPDLLVLDEPTNHLDSDTVRALCEALESFEGAIIAVSHDEAFVNRVIASAGTTGKPSDKTDAVDGDAGKLGGDIMVMAKQKVERFEGAFRDYKRMIRAQVMQGKDHNEI